MLQLLYVSVNFSAFYEQKSQVKRLPYFFYFRLFPEQQRDYLKLQFHHTFSKVFETKCFHSFSTKCSQYTNIQIPWKEPLATFLSQVKRISDVSLSMSLCLISYTKHTFQSETAVNIEWWVNWTRNIRVLPKKVQLRHNYLQLCAPSQRKQKSTEKGLVVNPIFRDEQ